jgi:hypothetical protein
MVPNTLAAECTINSDRFYEARPCKPETNPQPIKSSKVLLRPNPNSTSTDPAPRKGLSTDTVHRKTPSTDPSQTRQIFMYKSISKYNQWDTASKDRLIYTNHDKQTRKCMNQIVEYMERVKYIESQNFKRDPNYLRQKVPSPMNLHMGNLGVMSYGMKNYDTNGQPFYPGHANGIYAIQLQPSNKMILSNKVK